MESTTKQCPKCKEAIDINAKKCKHCKSDLRNWFIRHKILTGFLILFLALLLFGETNYKVTTSSHDEESNTIISTLKQNNTKKDAIMEITNGIIKYQPDTGALNVDLEITSKTDKLITNANVNIFIFDENEVLIKSSVEPIVNLLPNQVNKITLKQIDGIYGVSNYKITIDNVLYE